jgi:murein L,D-transpeptidase YcbB/YkuD
MPRLAAAHGRYAQIVAAGGWPRLDPAAASTAGEGAAAKTLQDRLAVEGYLAGAAAAASDRELAAALAAFQRAHGLAPDGVLGRESLAALNVPARERLAQIDANLERWRWLPHALPTDRLEVDVGAAQATLYRQGRVALEMRGIVGDPRHWTPLFVSRIEAIIVNPPWRVPTSIAAREILPRVRRDPGYLARNGFVITSRRLVQRPGPKNSLGVLKFDLTSPFGVYLHDTPSKSLFARADRALSHGCMRLEKPRELALLLLDDERGAGGLDAAIASGRTRRIALRRPTPLYVMYWTATANPSGVVAFRRDAYGWDAALNAALDGRPTAPAATGGGCRG